MSRSRPFWSRTGATAVTPAVVALPDGWSQIKLEVDTRSLAQVGADYVAPAVSATNAIFTISSAGTPDGGVFHAECWAGHPDMFVTADLDFDATAAEIKTALTDTLKFATGDISAAGGALPTDVTLTFTGVWAAIAPPISIVSEVTGGVNASINGRYTTLPDGNGNYIYVPANTQEIWVNDWRDGRGGRFLYIAAGTGTGNYYVSAYR